MALVTFDSSIVSMRGRSGGIYWKAGPDGQHIQAMPRVVNYTRSPAQQGTWSPGPLFAASGISGYSGASALWLMALCLYFSSLWAAFALTYLFVKKGKDPKKISGYNWYIHYALAFPECERSPFWKPPRAPKVLPSFLVEYRGHWSYGYRPQDWPAEAPTAYYYEFMPFNGKWSYNMDVGLWYLWWKDPVWVISPELGWEPWGMTYYSKTDDIRSRYTIPDTSHYTIVQWGSAAERDKPH